MLYNDTSLKNAESVYSSTTPIVPVHGAHFGAWVSSQPDKLRHWVEASGYTGAPNQRCLVPNPEGDMDRVLIGLDPEDGYWAFGALSRDLPAGTYHIDAQWEPEPLADASLAWGLGAYRFDRYQSPKERGPVLAVDQRVPYEQIRDKTNSLCLARDLINTPAADMMPEHMADVVEHLAKKYGASVRQIIGDELLEQNYPLIHAVGRASDHAPRLIDLTWGESANPAVTLVGKGVCFDSGGLDLKPAQGMRLMKKDMGGAAHVIGLASMIMARHLPLRLRVLIPAVENAIAGNAYRPGDVIHSRQGISIEIENTDAEGRLVLCDALAEAARDEPDLIIDFATLTGAARVALGTELPGLFSNDQKLISELISSARKVNDLVWPLPLHRPYRRQLRSDIADIMNSSPERFGGAITAALFLQEFIPKRQKWAHFDVMGWNLRPRPGRPKGGEAMGIRAVFNYLQKWLEN